jgi:anaerobic selenocysteine-containing dehydrogenase
MRLSLRSAGESKWRFSDDRIQARRQPSFLHPPVEKWDDWVEYDPEAWPRRVEKHYQLVPTICFNCESACGLLAYVDKETGQVAKFEGNPKHPASRGRLCAKGPATITQIHDPDRILYPMKRSGPRGGGKWTRTSWDEVLETFGARIRKAFQENRGEEVMYHVGRPGHDFIMERTLAGVGHRRPQLAHECVLVFGAAWLFALALCRSSFARPRQRALYSAALRAS